MVANTDWTKLKCAAKCLPYRKNATGDHTVMRQMNLSAILHHLRENAPISRATLADMTGLNKTTVSSLVGELIECQFVRRDRAAQMVKAPGAGRYC